MARGLARSQGVGARGVPEGLPHDLELVEPLGQHTWRGRADGDVPVAARWLGDAAPQVTFPPVSPALVPVLGLARTESACWLLSELDDGVSLDRLLDLARLSPLQAAAVLDDVHAGLGALHDLGHWHGRVHAANVHVGAGGRVRLSDWAPAWLSATPVDGHRGHRADDLTAAARLAGALVASAARSGHRADSRQGGLYAGLLRRTEVPPPTASLPPPLLDGDERARAGAELVTVVAALQRHRHPRRTLVPVPSAVEVAQPAVGVPLVSAGPPVLRQRPRRRRPAPKVLAVVMTALLAAAVVAEVGLLGPSIRANWHRLTAAPAGTAQHQGTIVAGAAVPTLAPAASGAVTRVAVRPLTTCTPGEVCALRVLVQVWPDDARRIPVAWTIEVVNTCTGARASYPGGAARVPVGADRVDGLSHVLLPDAPAVAVVAVTDQPAEAASTPVLVPARASAC